MNRVGERLPMNAGCVQRFTSLALAAFVALSASAPLDAQNKNLSQLTDAQKRDIQSVLTIVDEASAGRQAPSAFPIEWTREDFFKAEDHKTFVVFTVTIDPSALGGSDIAVYWRAVKSGTSSAAADQDVGFIPVSSAPKPLRVSRSFTVPAGSYDLFVAAREVEAASRGASAPKASLIKRSVTVPDYWDDELTTSSIVPLQRLETLTAPLPADEQVGRPYAMGTLELVPAWEPRFSRKAELQTFFLIYNPRIDAAKKPDVSVEYTFYSGGSGEAKLFTKTRPLELNAATLQRFDTVAGDQLQAGRLVPLASFPEGDYRLEIRITDKIANKSLTRNLAFTVTPY